jgi:hypothetical protein
LKSGSTELYAYANVGNGDGCSLTCLIESDFTCSQNLVHQLGSACYYVGPVNLVVSKITQSSDLKQMKVVMEVEPAQLAIWDSINLADIISV